MLLYITEISRDRGIYCALAEPVSDPVLVLSVEDDTPRDVLEEHVGDFLAFCKQAAIELVTHPRVRWNESFGMPMFEISGQGYFLLFDDWQWCDFMRDHCNPLIDKEASKRLRLSGFFERICKQELGWSDSLTARVLLACQSVQEIVTVIGTDVLDYGDTTPTFEELGIIAHGFEVRGEPRYAIHVMELAPFLEE